MEVVGLLFRIAMDEPQLIDLLEELAESFGVQISYDPIRLDEELGIRPGGACLFKGQRLNLSSCQFKREDRKQAV